MTLGHMATKQTVSATTTNFFTPVLKHRSKEGPSVTVESNMHDSATQDGSFSRTRSQTKVEVIILEQQPTLDIANILTASSSTSLDQVKYRLIKERKPPTNEVFQAKRTMTARERVVHTLGAAIASGLKRLTFWHTLGLQRV